MKNAATAIAFLYLATVVGAQLGTDYVDEVPPTVYEAEMMSPQNMDFDKENNMFIAHAGWYNDVEIHYYKFRIYAEGTYPDVIAPGSTASDVPIQKVFMVTTDNDFTGAVGNPIIEYHTSDGINYSDFMEVFFVEAPSNYTENVYRSTGDFMNSGATVSPSGAVLNLPVVPTNATLQHPHEGGTTAAPIQPTKVWYKGQEVWTYVFEVTTAEAKEYFDSTRDDDPDDFAFEVSLQTTFASPSTFDDNGELTAGAKVRAIPLWHFNQYSYGVTPGVNGGGPDPEGMRNLIQLDRMDAGYSPLWNIEWLTLLPVDYSADDVSNPADVDLSVGFDISETSMFINCPDIGEIGQEKNVPVDNSQFTAEIDATQESHVVFGSHSNLIFKDGVKVTFLAGDKEVASTETNVMGAYQFELMSCKIPAGTEELTVMAGGETIRTMAVTGDASESCVESGVASRLGVGVLLVLSMSLVLSP